LGNARTLDICAECDESVAEGDVSGAEGDDSAADGDGQLQMVTVDCGLTNYTAEPVEPSWMLGRYKSLCNYST
jgi:hypothetical protein